MKVTATEVIRSHERELLDAVAAELDWGAVEDVFKERHDLTFQEDVEGHRGDLVVRDGQIAYRLDFDVRIALSVFFDRQGNYLALEAAPRRAPVSEMAEAEDREPPPAGEVGDAPEGAEPSSSTLSEAV